MRAVVPHMRKQRKGHILNISSMASFMAEPGGGFYIASKLALEGVSGTLHYELQPFGIKVIIIEPGNFLTNFPVNSIFVNDTQIEEEEYEAFINERRNDVIESGMERSHLEEPGDPKKAALAMIKIVDSEHPIVRLALGTDAIESINYGLEYIKRDLDAWKELSISTDYDEVVANKT
ncbi:SDR family NAD(P)-dependent oxidoreductase [Nostoc sp. CHAB 5715]|nr:SDR family NAD(P)-dependent oxidoreductase [Nostoc sp. CHAB 5715]